MDAVNTWSVLVTRTGDEALLPRSEDTVQPFSDLAEFLGEYGAAVSHARGRYSVRLALEAPSAELAVSEAMKIVGTFGEKAGLPSWPFVDVRATAWPEFERSLDAPTFPNVLGVSELAQLLGVSRQRVSELARRSHFPKPFAELAAGPIWLEPTIRRFVSEWERRPGRPRSAAR